MSLVVRQRAQFLSDYLPQRDLNRCCQLTMDKRILLVEDEPGLVLTLTDLLTSENYAVENLTNGAAAVERIVTGGFDLILLDVMLPDKNGFDICRDARQRGVQTPILMLTARGQLLDKVLGLKLGADDYLTKPFEPLELLARIEVLLRRSNTHHISAEINAFQFGDVRVDFRGTQVRRANCVVELSAREFELLKFFIVHRGETISREHLLREVWGYDAEIHSRTVDVHLGTLRQKLETDAKNPHHFQTVRGFGYKFVE